VAFCGGATPSRRGAALSVDIYNYQCPAESISQSQILATSERFKIQHGDMGLTQAEHDANERKANAVIRWIPMINLLYSGIRAAVYEGKANHGGNDAETTAAYHREARLSGLDMASGLVDTATMAVLVK
jgi:hypothetical protein